MRDVRDWAVPSYIEVLTMMKSDCTGIAVSCPSLKRDSRYYWSYNSGLQAQAVLFRCEKSDLPAVVNDGGKPLLHKINPGVYYLIGCYLLL